MCKTHWTIVGLPHQYNQHKAMKVKLAFLIFLMISGCSSRGAYEGIQAGNRSECFKLPPSQYDECMSNANKSYDEYERERKEVVVQ